MARSVGTWYRDDGLGVPAGLAAVWSARTAPGL